MESNNPQVYGNAGYKNIIWRLGIHPWYGAHASGSLEIDLPTSGSVVLSSRELPRAN